MDVADILLLDSWAIHVPKLTLEGQVERHILELMATDQAAEIRQLGSENVLKTLVFRMSTGGLYHLKQKHLLKRHVFAWKDRLHVSSTTSCNILNRWWRHWCWDIFWVKKKKKKVVKDASWRGLPHSTLAHCEIWIVYKYCSQESTERSLSMLLSWCSISGFS